MPIRLFLFATICLMASFGARGDTQPLQFHGELSGRDEVPPNQTSGTGHFDGTLDRQNKVFTYMITYQGMTGLVTAAHFHGPATPGQNAPVVVPIQSPQTSPIKGSATLNDQQVQQLMANDWYVNLHTAAHPDGEIRSQVLHGGP